MPKSKIAIISIGVLVVISLVSLAFPTINMIKSISSKIESSDEVAAELNAEEKKVEGQAMEAISKTSEILGRKIVAVTQDDTSKNTIYTFDNGQKFELPLNTGNTCQVGDKISAYDESKNMLTCVDVTNPQNFQSRSMFIPNSWLSGVVGGTVGAVASSVIFGRFFGGNTYLKNNGYSPYYNNGQNGFSNARGDRFDFGDATGAQTNSSVGNTGRTGGNGGRGGSGSGTSITKTPNTSTGKSGTSGKAGSGKAGGTTGGFGSGGTTGTA